MTRFRLAATAALCVLALLVPASSAPGGTAPNDGYSVMLRNCWTMHTADQDFVDLISKVLWVKPGSGATAAAATPVNGAKVITKLKDLVQEDGNNAIDPRDSDRTNKNGVAETRHEFNNFGNYKVTSIAKVDGEVVARDSRKFGVGDRDSGKCDPTIEI